MILGMCCVKGAAQTKKRVPSSKSNTVITHTVTKTREVGEDGFIWHKLKKGNLYGVQDIEGKEIVPVKFDHIDYCASSYLYPTRFFRVRKGDFLGIYTRKGTCVITTNNHYIRLGGGTTPQGVADVVYWVAKKNDGGLIILDAKGKEIIPAERNYTEIKMMPDLDSHGTPYYFSVSQGNRRGICDLNGKELCPSIYESCYIAGGTIIKNEINGTSASENIHYQGNTIFDYLSYDDLYNYESSSMHSSPSSSSSSSSNTISSSNNNSDSGTTTIVVEQHGPVQVWVPCGGCQLSPGRCSYCNGSGWGYNNRLCSRCNGTGKCTICNGTGGHNEVQYR